MKRLRAIIILTALLLPGFALSQSPTLKGRIVLASAPKLPAPVRSARSQPACGATINSEALLLSNKLELENAVVFLANLKPEQFPPAAVATEIVNCIYKPRVTAILQGDTLVLRNADAAQHHARGYLYAFLPGWERVVTKNLFRRDSSEVFNFAFRTKNSTAWEVLRTPGLLEVRSETGEDWLKSYVFIMPHRYFSVTNAAGEFAFANLPPGKYDLIVWHELLGVKRQLLEVGAASKNEVLITWEMSKPASADSLARAQK